MIKYNVNVNKDDKYIITPSVENINIPSCRTSFSAIVGNDNNYSTTTEYYPNHG